MTHTPIPFKTERRITLGGGTVVAVSMEQLPDAQPGAYTVRLSIGSSLMTAAVTLSPPTKTAERGSVNGENRFELASALEDLVSLLRVELPPKAV